MIRGRITAPSDKSISHRALILAAVADGESEIKNCSDSRDVKSTVRMLKSLGTSIAKTGKDRFSIKGKGIQGFRNLQYENNLYLNAGNSGTSARLIMGLLAGAGIKANIIGDKSLSKRPMDRVKKPLQEMGAKIAGEKTLPMTCVSGIKKGIDFTPDIDSAQVKSALLTAGIFIEEKVCIHEKNLTRNHTENILRQMGADICVNGKHVEMKGGRELNPVKINIPGDFSGAVYLAVLAAVAKNAVITIDRVGLNPTRTSFLDAAKKMGVKYRVFNIADTYEPTGSIEVKSSCLNCIDINGAMVSSMIDEIPALAILAACAGGTSHFKGASELRKKESDRIKSLVKGFKKLGFDVREYRDGFSIKGKDAVEIAKKASAFRKIDDYGDHRIAMSFNILELAVTGRISRRYRSVGISYPEFYSDIMSVYLQGKIRKGILITGFMGSGKSTVGKNVAKKLKMKFFDLDREIEKQEKISIQEIFIEKGEKYFRELENKILSKLIENEPCVISTGGGTLLNGENLNRAVSNSDIFILKTDYETIRMRLMKENKRPLIKSSNLAEKEAKVRKYYEERQAAYDKIAGIKIYSSTSEEACEKLIYKLFKLNSKN